jgi:ABC-type molybdate transport system substrate-binding protein
MKAAAVARQTPPRPAAAVRQAPVRLLAAGSLRSALTAIGEEYRRRHGKSVEMTFGAAGSLRERIAGGEAADLFLSANMEHPWALAADRGLPVRQFARNRLCALAQSDIDARPDNLLDRLLDPKVRLGMSTPGADPSGDYALAVFERAERPAPRAAQRLKAKALRLTGAPNSPKPPGERSLYGWIMATRQADIFLTYRTNAAAAVAEVPHLRLVELPPELEVEAKYGLVVLSENPAAERFADFIFSPAGQAILAAHGFDPPRCGDAAG